MRLSSTQSTRARGRVRGRMCFDVAARGASSSSDDGEELHELGIERAARRFADELLPWRRAR